MPCKASRLESGVTLAAVRKTVSLVPVGDRQQFEPIDTGGGTKILGGLGIDRNTTDLDRIDTQRLPDGRPPSNQLRFPDRLGLPLAAGICNEDIDAVIFDRAGIVHSDPKAQGIS